MKATLLLAVEFDDRKVTADDVARAVTNVLGLGGGIMAAASPGVDPWAEFGGEPKVGTVVPAPFTHEVDGDGDLFLHWPVWDQALTTPPVTMLVSACGYGVVVSALPDDGREPMAEVMLDYHDNKLVARAYVRSDEQPVSSVEVVSDVASERKKPSEPDEE